MTRHSIAPPRNVWYSVLAVLLFGGFLSPVETFAEALKSQSRPNILFIYTDDHSYRTVGCYPQSFPWVQTPTMDELARQGVRFEYAYIGTWCMPSRATLLTGHYQFGVESMRMVGRYPGSDYDPEQCPFWPRVFRQHGYYTAHIGKWHTGVDTGYGRDWDYQIVWNRPKYPETSQNYYYDQPITYQGGETKILRRYSTDQYTDWAVDLIEERGQHKEQPWYLWLCYGAVHSPFTPADRHLEALPDIDVPVPDDIFPPRPGKPDWAQTINTWRRGFNNVPTLRNRSLASWVRQYHQGVLAIDEGMKRVLQALDETGQRDNTLIIFTSDQGFAWGQHGFRHKIAAYDSNIRSPLIISMPSQIQSGAVCKTPVGGVDLVPTIFRFAGLDLPWEMHGHDLTPLLRNPAVTWEHPVLMPATGQRYGSDTNQIPTGSDVLHGGIPWYVMLRKGNHKYVRALVSGELEELYDLSADPDELTNLAATSDHDTLLAELRSAATAELRRTGAGFVGRMPPYRRP